MPVSSASAKIELSELIADSRERVETGLATRADIDERALGDQLASPEGLTARSNTFDERDVLQEFASAARQGALVSETRGGAERFAQREDVLATTRGEMTTTELVECERRLIAAAVGRAGEGSGNIDPSLAERVIAAATYPLTGEQETAVHETVNSGDGVTVIQALAGTGKTFTRRAT